MKLIAVLGLRFRAYALCLFVPLLACAADAPSQPARPTSMAPVARPDRVLLLDLAMAGKRIVAVGERGVVFTSDNNGTSWQGQRTATTRTLTGVAFDGARVGVAVGHGGVLLNSQNGGSSWTPVALKDVGTDALLGVTVLSPGRFVAYGAFGLYLESTDGGKQWERRPIIGDDFDRHISKVIKLGSRQLLLGESGTLALAEDGVNWKQIASPYAGSWFGALQTRQGAALIFGMRGNVYRSDDGASQWTRVDVNDNQSIMNATLLPDGAIVLVGNAGFAARSDDDGKTFRRMTGGGSAGLAHAIHAGDALLTVGERGLARLPLAGKAAR